MKTILATLALMTSFNAFSFVSCNSESLTARDLPTLSVNFYHTDIIKALVTDRVADTLEAYICEKSSMTNDGNVLTTYVCKGGNYAGDKEIAVFIDEGSSLGNFMVIGNEDDDIEDLVCITE